MRFEWDEAKREANLRKHGVDFIGIEALFEGDWDRVDRMKDKDIDFSDLPEVPPEMFARAIVRQGLKPVSRKSQLTLRIDSDVLEWFRGRGAGYQSQMNAILRAYKEAHEKS